ncbi:hypothetical protein ANANG_G00166620 [Anguilla anguilla]|uniref:Uncharacterized protein n=1 Tax=Anguilla anguilla TaxID=7936 RepID=A0A9D3MFB6_ANGAN|nr:hypothetical protein ANANG_G00166620 [Anguilla anguilla]
MILPSYYSSLRSRNVTIGHILSFSPVAPVSLEDEEDSDQSDTLSGTESELGHAHSLPPGEMGITLAVAGETGLAVNAEMKATQTAATGGHVPGPGRLGSSQDIGLTGAEWLRRGLWGGSGDVCGCCPNRRRPLRSGGRSRSSGMGRGQMRRPFEGRSQSAPPPCGPPSATAANCAA